MEEFNTKISNFIFTLIKYSKVCKDDLNFAYDIFLKEEEYEKCSILKELIDIEYYDNTKKSNSKNILKVIEIANDNYSDLNKHKEKFISLKNELIDMMDSIEEDFYDIVIPPIKNSKNLEYFRKN